MAKNNWKSEIVNEMRDNKESWDDIVFAYIIDSDRTTKSDDKNSPLWEKTFEEYQPSEIPSFCIWTKKYVYFAVQCSEFATCFCQSAPRDPVRETVFIS